MSISLCVTLNNGLLCLYYCANEHNIRSTTNLKEEDIHLDRCFTVLGSKVLFGGFFFRLSGFFNRSILGLV